MNNTKVTCVQFYSFNYSSLDLNRASVMKYQILINVGLDCVKVTIELKETGRVSVPRLGENIPTWRARCLTGRLRHRVIKTAENIIGAHLQSISDIDEVPARDPKDSKLQHPPSRSLFTLPRKKHLSKPALYHWAKSSSFSLSPLSLII